MLTQNEMKWLMGATIQGGPGMKSKETHPYNYDPVMVWNRGEVSESSVYTDRLFMWDHEKHDRLCKKHFGDEGQFWNTRTPEQIEGFLQDYLGAPGLVLCEIQEQCKASTGCPTWYLGYRRAGEAALAS